MLKKIHFYSSNGFNKTQGVFYISDSLAGDVTRSEARFTELYNQLGKLSVVIQ
jgi:virulence-associated protein VapD